MARLLADRLAEVWAEPGRTGSGVVLGDHGILTARHVVADARGENDVVARVVRPGAVTAAWTPMEIAWEDPDWDLALLVVDERGHENWSAPQSPSPSFVTLGTAEEAGCETEDRIEWQRQEFMVVNGGRGEDDAADNGFDGTEKQAEEDDGFKGDVCG